MSNILTAQSKGKLKESGVQTGLTLLAAVVGGVTGQAIGKIGFLASVPVIFAGEYFEQPYVSALGAGMASSLTAPSSVSGLDGLDGTEKLINLKAAEARVKNYANNLKRAVFLGEVEPQGGNYAYYLSNADLSQEVGRISKNGNNQNHVRINSTQKRELMSQIGQYMEGLGEALADHDDFLEGHEDVPYSEIIYNIKENLEGIRDAAYSNPNELMGIDENGEEGLDRETIDTINGIIGMINGASMQGLNGNDEGFIEDLATEIGALEGLLGVEDDEDEFLNGNDEQDEFGNDMLSGGEEFSSELFGLDGEEESEFDIMGGIF